jgi:hypothetical protein
MDHHADGEGGRKDRLPSFPSQISALNKGTFNRSWKKGMRDSF